VDRDHSVGADRCRDGLPIGTDSVDDVEIVHQAEPLNAAAEAVKLVSVGKADILMKGFIHTDDFLRAVLNKEYGLRTGSIMSHVS